MIGGYWTEIQDLTAISTKLLITEYSKRFSILKFCQNQTKNLSLKRKRNVSNLSHFFKYIKVVDFERV